MGWRNDSSFSFSWCEKYYIRHKDLKKTTTHGKYNMFIASNILHCSPDPSYCFLFNLFLSSGTRKENKKESPLVESYICFHNH